MAHIDPIVPVERYFYFRTPTFMICILAFYLLVILKIGPIYMKNRTPYQLKNFIVFYNISQVLACIYLLRKTWSLTSSNVLCFWKCDMFEPILENHVKFDDICHFTFWLKLIELSETVVFVLRKKQNQVSLLHVFHHVSTVSVVYVIMKSNTGGSSTYSLFLNSIVHVIMYSYYLAAAVCSKNVVAQLTPIKKSITTIQMAQFTLILIQAIYNMIFCKVPMFVAIYYICVISTMFYGFYDFYKKSYTKSAEEKISNGLSRTKID